MGMVRVNQTKIAERRRERQKHFVHSVVFKITHIIYFNSHGGTPSTLHPAHVRLYRWAGNYCVFRMIIPIKNVVTGQFSPEERLMNVMKYGKCGYLSIKWKFSKSSYSNEYIRYSYDYKSV
jgi:hypothetical protein